MTFSCVPLRQLSAVASCDAASVRADPDLDVAREKEIPTSCPEYSTQHMMELHGAYLSTPGSLLGKV